MRSVFPRLAHFAFENSPFFVSFSKYYVDECNDEDDDKGDGCLLHVRLVVLGAVVGGGFPFFC